MTWPSGTALQHVVALLCVLLPAAAVAQRPGAPGARPRTGLSADSARRARNDTTKADSTKKQRAELVKWAQPDSVAAELLARPGFTATRYRGNTITFDARQREILLEGKAAVQRDQTIAVADTISYNDSTRFLRAARDTIHGDTIVLRDPAQGNDVVSLGHLTYNLQQRTGTTSDICTSVTEGETWYVCGKKAGFVGDTLANGQTRFYVHDGSITTCDLVEPHYHFTSGDIKVVAKGIIVARPAVLYIADIPVMWLPFIFQDTRSGRRSGILAPRLGLTDILRSSPTYRRQIENLGYYFAVNDYLDALVAFNWRSGARSTDADPGWVRYDGEMSYAWLDRFLRGSMRLSYSAFDNGVKNTAISWDHNQDFSLTSHLHSNFNYVSNTTAQRQQAFTIAQALAAIASSLNFQNQFGPASVSLGGSQRQYVGRKEIDRDFPNLSISTKPISKGDWLVWSPQLSVTNSTRSNIDQTAPVFRFQNAPGGVLDSVAVRQDTRSSTVNFQTPIRLLGFDWANSINVQDIENNFPQQVTILGVRDTTQRSTRVYQKGYRTSVDWQTGISLRPFFQGTWNLVPSVNIQNADPSLPFLLRTERSGGTFVSQPKRLAYGVSSSPVFYGLFRGIGPITRIRQSIQPTVSFTYAPTGKVSDAFLSASGQTAVGYLGALQQNSVSLRLVQTFEAKLRAPSDSNPETAPKIKLLSLEFSDLTYNFERARKTHRTGLETPTFTYNARSDLLPGFDLSVNYSLFAGVPQSDTARFKPYREGISARFSIGRDRNPFAALTQLFGKAVPSPTQVASPTGSAYPGGQQGGYQNPPIAGSAQSRYPQAVDATQGWEGTFSFNSTRPRPPVGAYVAVDPAAICLNYADPVLRRTCQTQLSAVTDSITPTAAGGLYQRLPPTANLRADFGFNLTPKWALRWGTGYDFVRHEFADHNVTLQRDLHDWRAIFNFSQSPNGNVAFSFYIALKAEPDLKFDYNRRTYRPFPGQQQ